jgi:type II secretion system protein J
MKSNFSAFTLVELMIALAIISVIATLSVTSFVTVRKVAEANRKNEESVRAIRWFANRLDVEISGTVWERGAQQLVFESKRTEVEGKKVNNLVFTTISPQSVFEIGKREEIIRVEYEVKENEEREQFLVLTKKVNYFPLADETNSRALEILIRDDFYSFQARFYRAGKWYDQWDAQKMDSLPEKIELVFSLNNKVYRELFNVFISET